MGNNYSEVFNAINDIPLSLGNIESDFKNMDLITPNQLKLGRNNKVVRNHLKILGENKKIFSIWFKGWYHTFQNWWSMVPQWLRCEICDVVLFIKNEGSVVNTYQYGMVHEID